MVTNCILWQNTDAGGADESAQLHDDSQESRSLVNYSCVQGWTGNLGGVGNTGVDPLLTDTDGADDICGTEDDDLRLLPGSPCIDAGFNHAVPVDLADLDGDGETGEFTPLDLEGSPRFADDPESADLGCGVAAIVDVGAYEFAGAEGQPARGDVDGDGSVGVLDLLDLLASWGPCPPDPGCCLADLKADGVVSVMDLAVLLERWD